MNNVLGTLRLFMYSRDAIGDQSSRRMFGTGGDAKGQLTQTTSL